MDWFKRNLGVKIFIAIWLLVLILPLWRLRASRHWQSDQLIDPIALTSEQTPAPVMLGLTPQNEEKTARLFPDDSIAQTLQPAGSLLRAEPEVEKVFTAYATVSARFPRDLLLRALWLRDATRGSLPVEGPELMASYKLPGSTTLSPPYIAKPQIQAAANCAREASRQEPDNAFWPWMEAIFEFSLRRDQAALTALDRAGKCTRFDDKTLETARRRIALMHRIRTADTEDDYHEAWAISYPHFGKLRSAARQTMWNAKSAVKRGDTARALEIVGILQRAAAPIAKPQNSFIGQLVGEALAYIAWRQALENADLKRPAAGESFEEYEKYRREVVARFAAYARRNGRHELAREALQIQSGFTSAPLRAVMQDLQYDHLAIKQNRLIRLHWLSAWLLRMSVIGALVWTVSFLLTRRRDFESQTQRATAIWAAFCFGATGAFLWGALHLGAVNEFIPWSPSTIDYTAGIRRSVPFYLAGIWLAPLVLPLIFGHLRLPKFDFKAREFGWLHLAQLGCYVGTVGGFLFVAVTLSSGVGHTIGSQLWPAPLFLFIGCALGVCYFHVRNTHPKMRISAALCLGAIGCWISYVLLSAQSREGYADITIAQIDNTSITFLGIAPLILIALALLLWSRAGGLQSDFFLRLLTRTRLTAAALAVVSSMAYFGVMVFSLPVRHEAQQMLNRQLEIGEAAWLLERLKR
ncbi:MAG TPA: hypothetical protein VF719_07975 [Abditibacteriaceae bacterium]